VTPSRSGIATSGANHAALARLTVNLGSNPGTTIQIGSISVQVGSATTPATIPPTIIVPPLPAGDSLTGCTSSPGTIAMLGTLGSTTVQTLTLSATAAVQAGTAGSFSCTTGQGRIVAAIEQYWNTAQVEVNTIPLGGGNFEIQATTNGFSEVTDVILTAYDGTGDDDSEAGTSGDVTAYFAIFLPAGGCFLGSVVAEGFGGDVDGGPAFAEGSLEVCYEPGPAPTVTLTPTDISGKLGDVFTFTATGSSPSGADGSYAWTITPDGSYPGSFQFVSSSCTSGPSCTPVAAPTCDGASSCRAYVQGLGTGFANIGVVFQGASASPRPRVRIIIPTVTKIWSDQFPGGPVANYLPGDGTQSNPAGDGSGAGLVGNARQLLIMGARSDSNGYLKANVSTIPNAQEAVNHVFVLFQKGQPSGQNPYGTSPNTNPPVGAWSSSGSLFSVSTPESTGEDDYSVVAGSANQGFVPAAQQISYTFTLDCTVQPLNGPPCSNGAVRIISSLEYQLYQLGAPPAGAIYMVANYGDVLPTALNFLTAFVTPETPGGASIGSPVPNYPNYIDTSLLLFNNGLVFDNSSIGPIYNFAFPSTSPLANHIGSDPDFQQLLKDTLLAHNADVVNYFNNSNNQGTNSYVFPAWQVADTCQSGVPSCYFDTDPSVEVDKPPLFPCATAPATECDLTFITDPDLQNSFGRVGYNLQLVATVSRSSTNPAQFVLTNLAFSGYIYDFYEWNPAESATLDQKASAVQAGYGTLGQGGQIYGTTVYLLTTGLNSFTWTFQ
jgi:hypothetical protein